MTKRNSTFETALNMSMTMNEPRAQRDQGRSGLSGGQGSIPSASASRTSAASSCSSSSTDCAAMHVVDNGPTRHSRIMNHCKQRLEANGVEAQV